MLTTALNVSTPCSPAPHAPLPIVPPCAVCALTRRVRCTTNRALLRLLDGRIRHLHAILIGATVLAGTVLWTPWSSLPAVLAFCVFGPVTLAAWLSGWRAGVAATAASIAILVAHICTHRTPGIGAEEVAVLAAAAVCAVLVWLIERGRREHQYIRQQLAREQQQVAQLQAYSRELSEATLAAREAEWEANTLRRLAEHTRADAERARREAEAANATKGRFLTVVSHELRTPLTTILGYAELLTDHVFGPVTAEQGDTLAKMQEAGDHLLALIEQILLFAEHDAVGLRADVEDVPLTTVVDDVCVAFAPEAERAGVTLSMPGPLDAFVSADTHKLSRILRHLVGNAIKFTPAGGVIALEAVLTPTQVELRVADSGPGIPMRQRELVFQPFVQLAAAETRCTGGAGLGLAISRALARVMGGDLTVDDAPLGGARFTLTLPRGRLNARPADPLLRAVPVLGQPADAVPAEQAA